MTLQGTMLIAGERVRGSVGVARSLAAASGEGLEPCYGGASAAEVAQACIAAGTAFETFRETTPEQRARFLEGIANEVDALGEPLIERAMAETALPRPRLIGEMARTSGQLRLFAAVLREGSWLGVTIDRAQPGRTPVPRPDLRLRRVALGPVAVFGASNFPLAFSVAGGDTASALAAGCPVVVKAHGAHLGTSELVAGAVDRARVAAGLPGGVFSMLVGADNAVGAALVADPRIKAVGFTGSRAGGLALAGSRPRAPSRSPSMPRCRRSTRCCCCQTHWRRAARRSRDRSSKR